MAAVLAVAGVLVTLALPAGASAQACDQSDPTAAQYCSPTQVVMESSGGDTASGEEAVAGGSSGGSGAGGALPFTGLDVAALFAVALALGGAGLGLRRVAAQRA